MNRPLSATRRERRPDCPASRLAIWQPQEPTLWILFGTLLACLPLSAQTIVAQSPELRLAGLGVLLVLVQGTLLWLLASWLLRANRLPRSLRLAAMSWGFVVAPVIAAFANTKWFEILTGHALHSFAAAIAAPFDEDLLRFAGILAILTLASRIRPITMLDGIGYGFLVGAGFEISENLLFVLSADDFQSGTHVALIRTGLGFGLHALWSGIQGALLVAGLARFRSRPISGSAMLAAGLVIPMLLHGLWDAPAFTLDYRWTLASLAIVYIISIGIVIGTRIYAIRTTDGLPRHADPEASS